MIPDTTLHEAPEASRGMSARDLTLLTVDAQLARYKGPVRKV